MAKYGQVARESAFEYLGKIIKRGNTIYGIATKEVGENGNYFNAASLSIP